MTNKKCTPKVFAVDFDGTCVAFDFPRVGVEIGAVPVLKELVAKGHLIILHTMRSDKTDPTSDDAEILTPNASDDTNYLSQAVMWFKKHDIPLYGVNYNPDQGSWTDSPKPYAHYYIDDIALGCPLIRDKTVSDRPYVDWGMMRFMLEARNLL